MAVTVVALVKAAVVLLVVAAAEVKAVAVAVTATAVAVPAVAVAVPAVAMTSRLILEREASAAMLVARAAVMVTGEGALSRCSRKRPSLQY